MSPKITFDRLESQEMEVLLVTATRTTRTIPTGTEGNDRVLAVVSETWSSSETGITLLDKKSDPRFADLEKRMTNRELSEPHAALFQVPADYTIKDQ